MSNNSVITKDIFRKRFGLKQREVILKSTGDRFVVISLNMGQKREIRERNLSINFGLKRGEEENATRLDAEGMMLDTIILACVNPKFTEDDRGMLENEIDSVYIQELYNEIETPVKLTDLDEIKLGNLKAS